MTTKQFNIRRRCRARSPRRGGFQQRARFLRFERLEERRVLQAAPVVIETWTGKGSDQLFTNTANWSGMAAPIDNNQTTYAAVFNTSGTVSVTLDVNLASTFSMEVIQGTVNLNLGGNSYSLTGTQVQLGAAGIGLNVGGEASPGAVLNISNGFFTTTDTTVASKPGGLSVLNVTSTATAAASFNSNSTSIAPSGHATVQLNGGSSGLGTVVIGQTNGSNGLLSLLSGTYVTTAAITLGDGKGSFGAVWVGGKSTLHTETMVVGASGSGTIDVVGGSTVVSKSSQSEQLPTVTIGEFSGSGGVVTVSGQKSTWAIDGGVDNGSYGLAVGLNSMGNADNGGNNLYGGVVNINGGGAVTVNGNTAIGWGEPVFGEIFPGSGELFVDGAGSSFKQNTGSLFLGLASGSYAYVAAEYGAAVTVTGGGSCIIGYTPDCDAEFAVLQATLSILDGGGITVGKSGWGLLEILSGRVGCTGRLTVGSNAGSHGGVVVSDQATGVVPLPQDPSVDWPTTPNNSAPELFAENGITVGAAGKGSFVVEGGATASAGIGPLTIGAQQAGNGTVTVADGGGLAFRTAYVGLNGTGEFDINGQAAGCTVAVGDGKGSHGSLSVGGLDRLDLTENPATGATGLTLGMPDDSGGSTAEVDVSEAGEIELNTNDEPREYRGGTIKGSGNIVDPNGDQVSIWTGYTVGAIIAPGSSSAPFSSLTLSGLDTSAGGTIEETLGAAGENSSLTVDGTVTLGESSNGENEGTLAISSADSEGYADNASFVVMHAADGITGSLNIDDTNAPPPPGEQWELETKADPSGGTDLVLYLAVSLDGLEVFPTGGGWPGSNPSDVTLVVLADLSEISGGHVDFYEASTSGLVSLGSVDTPDSGTDAYVLNTSVGSPSILPSTDETFWAVAADGNDDPVSNWVVATDSYPFSPQPELFTTPCV